MTLNSSNTKGWLYQLCPVIIEIKLLRVFCYWFLCLWSQTVVTTWYDWRQLWLMTINILCVPQQKPETKPMALIYNILSSFRSQRLAIEVSVHTRLCSHTSSKANELKRGLTRRWSFWGSIPNCCFELVLVNKLVWTESAEPMGYLCALAVWWGTGCP